MSLQHQINETKIIVNPFLTFPLKQIVKNNCHLNETYKPVLLQWHLQLTHCSIFLPLVYN